MSFSDGQGGGDPPRAAMYRFHVNLFALPTPATSAGVLELRGRRLPLLATKTFTECLPATFDEAIEKLNRLPRLDSEPDGFFVIAGDHEGRRWQVDGHLFEYEGRLHRMEIHGECPADDFDTLLACVGWPGTPLAFELVMEGVALEEAAFRAWAAS